jgi:hypothetical protein
MLQFCLWMRDVIEANQSSTSNKSLLRRLDVGCALRADPRYSYVCINKLHNHAGR